MTRWIGWVPRLLVLGGLAAIALASGADIMGAGGKGGFGAKQTLLAGTGTAMVALGLLLASRSAQRALERLRTRAARTPPVGTLMTAAWIGLAAGLVEVGFHYYERYIAGATTSMPFDVFWMAPVVDLVVLLAVALPLWLLGRVRPGLVTPERTVGLLGFVALAMVLVNLEALHWAARLLLAAGLAAQLARLSARHVEPFSLIVRATFGWLALPRLASQHGREEDGPTRREFVASSSSVLAAVAVAMASDPLRPLHVTASRVAARAPSEMRPSILFIVWDTVRAASLGLHGYARATTPTLDAIAREAVVFDQAIAPAPWTLPTHGTLFTGRYPHHLATGWNTPLSARYPTLAETLGHLGYESAGIVSNLHYTHRYFGLARGFDFYDDFPRSPGQALLTTGLGEAIRNSGRVRETIGLKDELNRRPARSVSDSFVEWHAERGGRPYFAFLNYYDAHAPYLPPEPYATRFADARPRRMDMGGELTPGEVAALQAAYDGAIAYLDAELDRVLGTLEARSELEQTIVVVLSDHGEEFYEHGLMDHANSLYIASLHVPLVVRFPRAANGGKRVTTAVSLRDLPATLLESVEPGAGEALPGHSLLPAIVGEVTPRSPAISELLSRPWLPEHIPASQGTMHSIVSDGMHYIYSHGSGRGELYALAQDYWQQHDLSATADGRRRAARLRARLDEALAS